MYVIILGGICILIGIFINLVVYGMILEFGYEGFIMFELGKVGIFIVIVGIIYLFVFFKKLFLDVCFDIVVFDEEVEEGDKFYCVEVVFGVCFLGINKILGEFNFKCYYGVEVKEIKKCNG